MNKKIHPTNIILFLWCVLCTAIYVLFSARVTYVQTINIYFPTLTVQENIAGVFLSRYLVNIIPSILAICFFVVSCISLGEFTLNFIKFKSFSSLALFTTWFLVGNALYSAIFLYLASIGHLKLSLILLLLCTSVVISIVKNINKINFIKIYIKQINKQEILLLILVLGLILSTLLLSSARISYDSTAIYFSDAKITAYLEGIQYFKEATFVTSAFQNSIQFSAIIQIFGEQSARMLSWVCGIAIIIFVLEISEKLGNSRKSKWILLTLLLTSTAFIDLLGDGKVDLINSAYAIAAIYWMINEHEKQPKSKYILIGFLAGMAIIGRPYNVFLLVVFVFIYYFQIINWKTKLIQGNIISFVTPLLWISLGAIPLGFFHLFINWMIQGNVFAFLESLSGINSASGPWDNDSKSILWLRLLYPVIATFRNTPQSLGNISPLALGIFPFWLIPSIRNAIVISLGAKKLFRTALISLVCWISVFFTVVELRYVFFLWFILLIPVSQLIESVINNVETIISDFIKVVAYILLAFMIFRTNIIAISSYSPIDEKGNPQCQYHIVCEFAINPINNIALPNERVLSLSAYRYYLRNDLFYCSSNHEDYRLLQESAMQSTDAFWIEVVQQGYQYIAYELEYTKRHLQLAFIPSPENTPSWLKLEEITKSSQPEFATAYKIILDNPPMEAKKNCRPNQKNLLEVQLLP